MPQQASPENQSRTVREIMYDKLKSNESNDANHPHELQRMIPVRPAVFAVLQFLRTEKGKFLRTARTADYQMVVFILQKLILTTL